MHPAARIDEDQVADGLAVVPTDAVAAYVDSNRLWSFVCRGHGYPLQVAWNRSEFFVYCDFSGGGG